MLTQSLSSATAHRIDSQIKRAFNNTYGAETGLRTLVRLGSSEMLRTGASVQTIKSALTDRVRLHSPDYNTSRVAGEIRSAALTKMIKVWCEEACAPLPPDAHAAIA
jgi:hypothetical protein